MKCCLCLREGNLLKSSHIIPDFMYRDLFDEKHRLVKMMGLDISKAKKIQTGEKDSNILCPRCDNEVLGSLEEYACRALFTGKGKDIKNIHTRNQSHPDGILTSTYCKNLDYTKFKLFLLSILWRASISKLDFFGQVQLGPIEESLRKMIFENRPLSQMDFPCVVLSFRYLPRHMTSKVITSPRKIRSGMGIQYLFQIGQLVFVFFVSRNTTPTWLSDAAITPEGKMRIVHFDNERGKTLMENLFGPIAVQALYLAATGDQRKNGKRGA